MISKRILVVGSGSLGVPLSQMFAEHGHQVTITIRDSSEVLKSQFKLALQKSELIKTITCNNLQDYQQKVNEIRPEFMVITIPQPDPELLHTLLNADDCQKVYTSSPAADFARACPTKVKPGSYPFDKCRDEDIVNSRGKAFGDALALQIGFIPEIREFMGQPIPSGLALKTMLTCLLKTGDYDEDIALFDKIDNKTGKPIMRTALDNADLSKGFTCTSVYGLFRFLNGMVNRELTVPKKYWGQTFANHSSKIWPREVIVKTLNDSKYQNSLPDFYGAKNQYGISQPAKNFIGVFGPKLGIGHDDIKDAVRNSRDVFENHKERLLSVFLKYAV